MAIKKPILLSFYALSNGKDALIFGQITKTRLNDLSFTGFTRRRTFKTLFSLYRTRAITNHSIKLVFDEMTIETTTDDTGSFFLKHKVERVQSILQKVVLDNEEEVLLMEGLYSKAIHYVVSPFMIISNIDDTLLHSYIGTRLRRFRTLLFTPVERRKPVVPMQSLMNTLTQGGATALYLSNSEQNLYPMIYRFLTKNSFPSGPLFLRRLRRLRDVLRYWRLSEKERHKVKMLDEIFPMFPDKRFALIGDNTQHDLTIYLEAARKFPEAIKYILIRKVAERPEDEVVIKREHAGLEAAKIQLYYGESFPSEFSWS
jgi:phosphatidate phosphatase APP1